MPMGPSQIVKKRVIKPVKAGKPTNKPGNTFKAKKVGKSFKHSMPC